MWELDCEESWVPKNWCFWTVVLEKTLESPLDCKEIQPVHPKGDHPWVFFGRSDAEAETPVLWPPHANSWLIGRDSDAGKDWGQEEKGTTEDEMAGWHHRLDGREFEWTPKLVMDREAWRAAIHGVAKSWTWLSDWTELNWTHSSVLAWRIPGTADPGGLPSMGLHRVGHNWSNLAAAATFHCIDIPHLVHPFISWWTLGLFLLSGYHKQCYQYYEYNVVNTMYIHIQLLIWIHFHSF